MQVERVQRGKPQRFMPPATKDELEKAVNLAREIRQRERYNRIDFYDPYPYQLAFHETGSAANQRLLMAANRIGKSYCGSMEMSYHLTGLYPSWWKGRRFTQPIVGWAGGVSNETTRDIVQFELLGSPDDPEAFGSGTVPRKLIIKTERKPGVPNAKSVALIKHVSGGNSSLFFKAYEMGVEKWQGRSVDCIWLDEAPSHTNSTWDDASEKVLSMKGKRGHLSEVVMEQILSSYSPHEREMRRYGRPSIGSGLVFPLSEEKIMVDPFHIEDHWPRIAAIDFGWDHPTAVVWCALDREEETFYVYDCYRASKASPTVHAGVIRSRPHFIPIAYPHDGNRRDSMGNPGLADQYRNMGCNFMLEHFTNPPALGENKGSNSIEEGLMAILQSIEADKFKVFSTLPDWFEEFRMYHRKDNKVVPLRDDLMSATRYAFQSQRFAVAGKDPEWTKDIEYRNYGII